MSSTSVTTSLRIIIVVAYAQKSVPGSAVGHLIAGLLVIIIIGIRQRGVDINGRLVLGKNCSSMPSGGPVMDMNLPITPYGLSTSNGNGSTVIVVNKLH